MKQKRLFVSSGKFPQLFQLLVIFVRLCVFAVCHLSRRVAIQLHRNRLCRIYIHGYDNASRYIVRYIWKVHDKGREPSHFPLNVTKEQDPLPATVTSLSVCGSRNGMKPGVNDEQKNKERMSEGSPRKRKEKQRRECDGRQREVGLEGRNANIERKREKNEKRVIIEREGRCYRLIK